MNVSAITQTAKKLGGKPLGVASKVLGVAALASVVYDSHVNGRERAYAKDSIKSADRFFNQHRQFSTMEKSSATLAKVKKVWYNAQQDFDYLHIGDKITGYLLGFGQTVVDNIPLIGLSALALATKQVGKVAGVLIAVDGIKTLLCDVMGGGNERQKTNF